MSLSKPREIVKDREAWHATVHEVTRVGHNLATTVAQMVKNLPEVQETWVQSLGKEDPLKKGMATHKGFFLENSMDK